MRGFDSPEEEGAFVLERVRALAAEGVPYEEMAVLMRLNARSVDFEELFGDAQIPFQGSALLARDGARQLLKALRGAGFGSLSEEVRRVAREQGMAEPVPDGVGERELVRQADLAPALQAGRGVRRRLAHGRGVGRSGCARASTTARRAACTC